MHAHLDDRAGGDGAGVDDGLVRRGDLPGDRAGGGVAEHGPAGRGQGCEVGGRGGAVAGDDRGADEHRGDADQGEQPGQRDHPHGGRTTLPVPGRLGTGHGV
ncbi:hypothetical protein GCM10023328_26070 [Modestobacter marinus]|uniref:Uncharacterized protein n=1 Tax=Modestobacter marinus TaxID=477641 RepID=A0ABQ2FWS9_9ACTN|nr:hypothetical protein GCM10011589_16810 [Modestobacter marinus]